MREVAIVKIARHLQIPQCELRLKQYDLPGLPHVFLGRLVDPKRLALHAVPAELTFPGLEVELLDVRFDMNKHPADDDWTVSKICPLAAEAYFESDVSQRCMRQSFRHHYLHEFSQQKIRQAGVREKVAHDPGESPPIKLARAAPLRCVF